jgi:nitrogen fixation/metabolism regulation signal transduction histidine kinase
VRLYFIPLYILGFLLVLIAVFLALSRIRGGRYLRPVVGALAKIPLVRKGMVKASKAALERQNPDLASAFDKLERSGATRDPAKAQAAMSRLTVQERKAYFEAVGEQQAQADAPQAANRAQRRQLERMKKGRGPTPQRKRSP